MAKPEDIVTEAKKRFERAKSFYGTARLLAIEDTRFAMGDSDNGWQWPQDVAQSRKQAQRVQLTVNTTAQHCNQVINQIRQNRPSCKVSAVDNGADKKTADIFGGLIRNIQASSNADDAHDIAAEHATYGGEGYWRITTDYESESSFDQCINIKPLPNPNRVYIDIEAKELDKSDAEWGIIFEDYSKTRLKREHPDIDPASWVDDRSGWIIDKDTFVRAEYFYCVYDKDTACLYQDYDGQEQTVLKSNVDEVNRLLSEGFFQALDKNGKPKERDTQVKKWKHCIIIGGHEKPLDETEWAGSYLPIVSIVGKEVNINGEVVRKGLVRDLKDPARIVNYAYSETVQTLALQNKIPYLAAAEAIEGHEVAWQGANTSNDSYLPFNAYDADGNALPTPKRQEPAVMPAAQIQLLELSLAQMRGTSGQQNANFGIKSEAASGIGIQRLAAQGEVATFHFPDNQARGLKYEARLLIDLIPKIYTKAKIVRILGLDGKPETVMLNPDMPQAYHEQPNGEDIQRIFNPGVGRYDVVIDTGPGFKTQRQESAAMMAEFVKADPTLMQKAGDIIVRSNDFQDGEKLAERLEKFLPPGVADKKGGGPEAEIAKLQQQIQMMEQESQQHIQEGMKLEQENESLKTGEQSKIASAQATQEKAQIDATLKREQMDLNAQLAREEAQIQAELAIEKAKIDAETKVKVTLITKQADMSMAEPKEIEKEAETPEKPSRKVITIQAPSGAVYTGTIEESENEDSITIQSPSGGIYTGSIAGE